MKNKTKLKSYVKSFVGHMGNAIESIRLAAETYYEACLYFPHDAQAAFEEAYPHVSAVTWDKLRAVGAGDLEPAAMLLSNKFCAKIARMPRQKQTEVLNGDSFTVFNPTTREAERVNYGELKPRHERILFDEQRSRIRNLPEQVAYCDMVAAQRIATHRDYTVYSDRLEVHNACTIGRQEINDIIEEMDK